MYELGALPQTVSIFHCVREDAEDIHKELKTLPGPIVHVVRDLISYSNEKPNLTPTEIKKDYIKNIPSNFIPWKLL